MKLTWYFDFISPFAYLQHCQFGSLPQDLEIEYKPVLLAGLLNHWDNVGPAEIAPKRTFTYKHCYWLAKKMGIDYQMPPAHPFNSLKLLRLAIALNCQPQAIQTLFESVWKHGLAIDDKHLNTHLSKALKLTKNIDSLISQESVKEQLKSNTSEAANQGVFGVPTFVVENKSQEIFWGLDSFEMLLDYLANPKDFLAPQYQALEFVPLGSVRKR